jgi:hypothetical protein
MAEETKMVTAARKKVNVIVADDDCRVGEGTMKVVEGQ